MGTALLAKEGAAPLLAWALLELKAGQRLKTLQICGRARNVWGRERRPGQHWLWNTVVGYSLRLKPPRKEQCQCLTIILPVKFKLICLCRRDHIVELRASEGDWRTHPALNLRHPVFPEGTLGIDQGMSWTVGPGKRINLVHLQHRGVPSSSPAEVCFWPTLQLSEVKGNGSRLEVCTPAAGFWWYWRLRYLVRAWAEALSSSG